VAGGGVAVTARCVTPTPPVTAMDTGLGAGGVRAPCMARVRGWGSRPGGGREGGWAGEDVTDEKSTSLDRSPCSLTYKHQTDWHY
jgi:hypothetical protein